MSTANRVSVGICSFLLACTTVLVNANELPRYKLEVGQQLTYKSALDFKYERGSLKHENDCVIWVVSQNEDGGWRLIIRDAMRSGGAGKPNITFAYLDLAPDGSYELNPSLGYRFDPSNIFIPLPKDRSQAESGWQGSGPYDVVVHCHQDTKADAKEGLYVIDVVRTSPMDEIYLSTSTGTAFFDTEQGLVQRVETQLTQGYGFNGKGTGEMTLQSVEVKEADWLPTFEKEATAYFETAQRYDEMLEDATESAQSEELLRQAKTLLEAGKRDATHETVIDQYSERLANHDQTAKYQIDQAQRRAQVIGKPAFDFSTTDFDGESHALKQYHGQVVILDFWYRGCGWCIRAMPQIKEVAETFEEQPVQVFGMNTDRKEEDARFVIDKMQLNYPNLKAEGLPEKFHVRGFPTLVIIDQEGVVRDLHVGYAADLADEVTKSVRELLGES